MYVCICKAITDKQLEEARNSSKSIKDVCKTLGLGSECGSCLQEAIQFIQKSPKQTKEVPSNSSN